jgi:hypothetical protein
MRMATIHTHPKAQSSVEYFILFAIIAVITILSFSSFLPKVKETIQGSSTKQGFFQKAATEITNTNDYGN